MISSKQDMMPYTTYLVKHIVKKYKTAIAETTCNGTRLDVLYSDKNMFF